MEKTLIVIAETNHEDALTLPTLECLEEAREVADVRSMTVQALLPGYATAELTDTLAAHGADVITLIEHPALSQFSAEGWLAALEPVLKEASPMLVLAPDSGHVRAWLPRLAARWRVPLVSGCTQVQAGSGSDLELTRPTHGGARYEQLVWPGAGTLFVTLVPNVRGITPPRQPRQAKINRQTPTLDAARFRDRALHTIPADPRTVDLTEAERIISGGLGVGGPEGMAMLRELADQLGAALGGTRVVSDRGWLAVDRFIGTTGKIVAPRLYIAFGVSGAGQHISGITESETVIAVNTDRTAPLFSMADLSVVGDLHQIVPALIAKLQNSSTTSPATDEARVAQVEHAA